MAARAPSCWLLLLLVAAGSADQHVMRLAASHQPTPERLVSAAPVDLGGVDLPRLVAEAAAASQGEPQSLCATHSADFLRALDNYTLWAVQMYGASVRAPSGVVYGSVYQLGHFDQCVTVKTSQLRGQYCLPDITVSPRKPQPLPQDIYQLDFDQEQSAWNKLQFAGDEMKIRRDIVPWALCVPSSCSVDQVRRSLDAVLRALSPQLELDFRVELSDDYCQVADTTRAYIPRVAIYMCVTAILLLLVALGTFYDMQHAEKSDIFNPKKESMAKEIIMCFSAVRNMKKISSYKNSDKYLNVFHFLRTLFILSIIAGHRLISYCGFPVFGGDEADKLFRRPESMIVANGAVYVDIFFTLGGFSLAYTLYESLDKTPKFLNLFLAIVNRYLRLTPLYLYILMFSVCILPYVGSGPLWKATVLKEQERCETNWWANILYINNYIDPSNMCMFQSWYLSVDFHMFVLSLFLVYTTWRWRRVGWSLIVLTTLLSLIVPFFTMYIYNLHPLVRPFPRFLKNFRLNEVFLNVYVPTQNRATPYLTGVIAGILVYKGRLSSLVFPRVPALIAYHMAWALGLAIIFVAYIFFMPTRPYSALEGALYGSLHRLGIGFITVVIGASAALGESEQLRRFLSARIFVIISRLSYAAFLVHTIPQLYDQGSLRSPRHIDAYHGISEAFGDFCITFAFSFILNLMIEAPIRTIVNLLLGRKKGS